MQHIKLAKTFLGDNRNCINGIWINNEFCICTNKYHSKWQRFWMYILLGWRIETREAFEELKGLTN